MYALTTTTRILSLFKKKKIATFGRRCDDILMPTILFAYRQDRHDSNITTAFSNRQNLMKN